MAASRTLKRRSNDMKESETMKEIQQYRDHIVSLIDSVFSTQIAAIGQAAELMVEAIRQGHSIFAFGASHSGMIAMEFVYRTGGLVNVNPLFDPGLLLNVRPITKTSEFERLAGYGKIVFEQSPVKQGDVLIVHSVSGRNAAPVDLAMEARKHGVKVIGITSLSYSSQVTSRHPLGLKLCDVVDVVIDNCGEFEDACLHIEGLPQKIAPTSTIAGAFIANALVIQVARLCIEAGIEVPVFRSANADGGDAFNQQLLDKYKDRIHYMD